MAGLSITEMEQYVYMKTLLRTQMNNSTYKRAVSLVLEKILGECRARDDSLDAEYAIYEIARELEIRLDENCIYFYEEEYRKENER